MIEIVREVTLDDPLLVVGLDGWIDAGLGGAQAVGALLEHIPTEIIATFDPDVVIDYRARRPVMRIENGVNVGLTWQEIQLRAGQDRTGRDVLLLIGPEPDMRWREFTAAVVDLAQDMGVRMMAGLGAFPAPVPHTRPVRLAATATTEELAATVGFLPGSIDVPSGILGALERGFAEAGLDAVGLWARVPHYLANMPYPAAAVALLEGLARLAGISVYAGDLRDAAAATLARIEESIGNSPEHLQMVSQLEEQVDSLQPTEGLDLSTLPTGDEIAAELQRFLRGEQP